MTQSIVILAHQRQLLAVIFLLLILLVIQRTDFRPAISLQEEQELLYAPVVQNTIQVSRQRPELMEGMLYDHDGATVYLGDPDPIEWAFNYPESNIKQDISLIPKHIPSEIKLSRYVFTLQLVAQAEGYMEDKTEDEKELTNRLLKLTARSVKYYSKSERVNKIVIVWNVAHKNSKVSDTVTERLRQLQADFINPREGRAISVAVVKEQGLNVNAAMKPHVFVETDAVFLVRVGVLVDLKDLDYGFRMWKFFPNLLVTYTTNTRPREKIDEPFTEPCNFLNGDESITLEKTEHYGGICLERTPEQQLIFENHPRQVLYSTVPVTLTGSFFHKKYLDIYTYQITTAAKQYANAHPYYLDLVIQQAISYISQHPPIMVKPQKPIYIPEHHFKRHPAHAEDLVAQANKVSRLIRGGQEHVVFSSFKIERVALRDVT
jgi:hypothetical protein